MALIYCEKCGNQISDLAPKCPHCGAVNNLVQPQPPQLQPPQPQPQPPKKNKSGLIAVIAIAVIFCIGCAILAPSMVQNSSSKSSTYSNPANSMLDRGSRTYSSVDDDDDYYGYDDYDDYDDYDNYTNNSYTVILNAKVEHNMLMGKYDVDVLVDGHTIATLGDGQSTSIDLNLEYGVHEITFQENGNPTNQTVRTETITSDTTLSYSIKRRGERDVVHGYGIDVTKS